MAVLSVDLAYRRWADLGVVILSRSALPERHEGVTCEIVPLSDPGLDTGDDNGSVDPNILAGRLNHLCATRDIRIMLLDGPQAWKSRSNGLAHARVSERILNTAAKTGLPGIVKPVTYRPFAEFCVDVYDALCRRGWRRLDTQNGAERNNPHASPNERILVESYPYAAWRSLGLKPLPSKRRATVSDLAEAYRALHSLIPFTTNRPPNHDQLQAIVSGLPGLALEQDNPSTMCIVGNPPRREDGHWREGFIVLPAAPSRVGTIRWLN